MHGIKIKVNAKVNLSLNISGVRGDGMHLLDMVLTSVNIADVITVTAKNFGETTVEYSRGERFVNDTVLRTANLVQTDFPHIKSTILIEKKIPQSAGLGGSSADAAGLLFAIDKIFHQQLTPAKIAATALKAGSDVPYLLTGGFAHVQSTGEAIKKFSVITPLNLVICKGRRGVDTALSYKKFDELYKTKAYSPTDNNKLISALQNADLKTIASEMQNALEKGSSEIEPSIITTLDALNKTGCLASTMSGSGSSCIGLYETKVQAQKAQTFLRKQGLYAQAVESKNEGIEIIDMF